MRILHIVKQIEDERAITMAKAHSRAHQVSVLLLHDAVLTVRDIPGAVYACADDVRARNVDVSRELVDYDTIVRLVFEHDKVISW